MIQSFGNRETELVFLRERVPKLDTRIHKSANKKLHQLDAAVSLDSLRVPPGNRLEALKGDRKGTFSIRVNDQWRITFSVDECGARTSDHRGLPLRNAMSNKLYPPIHPGEILLEDFIEGFGITQHKLAVSIGVPPRRINEIVHGKRGITADTALRLGKFFGVEPMFWMNLQNQYEIEVAEDKALAEIERIQPVQAASA